MSPNDDRRPAAPPRRGPSRVAILGGLIALLGLLLVASVTLVSTPGSVGHPSMCLICAEYGGVDFLLNVLLFIPYGFGARLTGMKRARALALIVGTTVVIELLQLSVVTGRDASLGDIISNALGGAVGVGLAEARRTLLTPTVREARLLLSAGAFAWLAALLLGATLMQPRLTNPPYWGEWAPGFHPEDTFFGRVLEVYLGRERMVNNGTGDPMVDPAGFVRRFESGPRVSARLVPSNPTEGRVPLIRATDPSSDEMFLIAQHGRDLFFQVRTRSRDWRLRAPALLLERAFPERANGESIAIVSELRDHRLWATVSGPNGSRSAVLSLTPTLSWSLLLPFQFGLSDETARWVNGLWSAMLVLPIGFWGAWMRRDRDATLAIAVLLVISLGAVPAIARSARSSTPDVVLTAAGAFVGWLAGRLYRDRVRLTEPDRGDV
jgi:hypothetical protein